MTDEAPKDWASDPVADDCLVPRVIGEWRDGSHPERPDPSALVAPGWDWLERGAVIRYLQWGTIMSRGGGSEPCRMCADRIGDDLLTNGRYVWRSGLEHYVSAHAVRLPAEVLDHATDTGRLRQVGYWRGQADDRLPDPRDLVDHAWDRQERELVASYLDRGSVMHAWFGYSDCRICGVPNGDCDLTDGVYLWPSGLRHYLDEHAVRLPQPFVAHVGQLVHEIEDAPFDVEWWLAATRA